MTDTRSSKEILQETLQSVRNLLGMQVAFVSEFADGRRVFRYVDAEPGSIELPVGGSDPLEESYCQRVVDGRLPELIRDARKLPEALALPVTEALPVGAHLSVPIVFSDGRVYGTFCCFSTRPDESLNDRDIRTMRLFADVTRGILERQVVEERAHDETVARIRDVLEHEQFSIVYQPIFRVAESAVVGYEALARFSGEPVRTPDKWFNEAGEVGLQTELELAAIRKALQGLQRLQVECYLSLNISPQTVVRGSVDGVFDGFPLDRLVLEVTEHASVADYETLEGVLRPLRSRGLRLAIDDAGAGYSSFRHILRLKPDIIKLDMSLIQKIDSDPGSQALAVALIWFANETGSKVVAEGVETEAELRTLQRLRVNKAQGFLLGRPQPLDALLH